MESRRGVCRQLGVEVDTTGNLFDLCGHSVMVTKLVNCISRRLDARVSVKYVFDLPVLVGLRVAIP